MVELVNHMGFHVRSAQPWISGVGLFEVRDAGESFALVQMPPQDLGLDRFVRFMRHDHGEGFRGVQGFRQGCLMFLGVPLDLRNEENLRAAVNTFGKIHHWISDDPYLVRSIVFASFPEDILVPRDVVFSDYADWGGAKVSWTAPCYILGANFAEQMPQDEDPMPIDGNPHPLPGHLIHEDNIFALPPYPALGWNDVPPPPPPVDVNQGGGWGWDDDAQAPADDAANAEVPDQESIVINQQDFSGSVNQSDSSIPPAPPEIVHLDAVEVEDHPPVVVAEPDQLHPVIAPLDAGDLMPGLEVAPGDDLQPPEALLGNDIQNAAMPADPDAWAIVPYQQPIVSRQDLFAGRLNVVYGPPLPPEMAWKRTFDTLLGRCSTMHVPKQVFQASFQPLILSKRSWSLAFEKVRWVSELIPIDSAGFVVPLSVASPLSGPACALLADSSQELEPGFGLQPVTAAEEQFSFSAPAPKTKRVTKRDRAPVVDSDLRRCTRSSIKRDGFKPVLQALPMTEPKKKKPRPKPFAEDDHVPRSTPVPPPTPIIHIQQIGADLGIAADKLTADALMADPSSAKGNSSDV